jgi:hypothetical protein
MLLKLKAGSLMSVPFALLVLAGAGGCRMPAGAQPEPPAQSPELLPWSEQVRIREGWLETRHGMLLEMMRRHDIGMWIVVNEEFNDDPLTQFVAPPRPYTGHSDLFIFVDTGHELRREAKTGF